jgi:carboxylesterase type B
VPHISDVPFVFDEVKGVDPNATTADVSLGLSMSSSWAAFGSKGAPGSVTDWPVAYSNLPTDIKIKVFGGESSGVWNISTAPGEENTLERCRYVLDIFDQLQT